jgi:alcohol dehydrogenase class IV
MEANVRALQARAPESPALERYDEAARILTGRGEARAADGIAWVHQLGESLGVRPLSDFGPREADFSDVAAQAQKASSMQGNPVRLSDEELVEVLRRAA